MVILPRQHPFAMYWMRPVWGRATLGTVVLWPLATVVQFGVGSIFYRRSFGPLAIRMKRLFLISSPRLKVKHDRPRSLSWHDLISFGSMGQFPAFLSRGCELNHKIYSLSCLPPLHISPLFQCSFLTCNRPRRVNRQKLNLTLLSSSSCSF